MDTKRSIWPVVLFAGAVAAIVSIIAVAALVPGRSATTDAGQTVVTEDGPVGASGGAVTSNVDTFTNGLTLGTETTFWAGKTLGPGTDQVELLRNRSGRTIYADYGEFGFTSGTASSSLKVQMLATTTTSIAGQYLRTALSFATGFLIAPTTYATSTTATTTNSTIAKGNGTVAIPDGSSLIAYIQGVDTIACGTAGACESATSTNRGVSNFFAKARLHYTR